MLPFNHTTLDISKHIKLTIIDIPDLNGPIKKLLDKNFVLICEGNSGSALSTVKKEISNLFASKNDTWKMGAIAEFFVHLYVHLIGFKQECLFSNLEENSIKKGFDGYYSNDGIEWIMESKSGLIDNDGVSHASKVSLAIKDLENKVAGKTTNNPWKNAYFHASLYDVGTADSIRQNIKKLSTDFINKKYHAIDEFNTMPCGTVFLSGIWIDISHEEIYKSILEIESKLKGKNVHVICITQKSINMFSQYLQTEA